MDRRDFIKRSGLVSGLATVPAWAVAVNTAPTKVRIGVVGGGFGCSFQWHEHPDCAVQAVSDLREDRRKNLIQTYGCTTVYNSLAELVRDKNVDAVAIFTDGPLHVEHTVEAMKHGKHVISAVPAAWATLEQAYLLSDTVNKYGLTYMMAETGYYQQSTISARNWYKKNLFGSLYYSEAEYQHPGLEVLYWWNGKRTWRYGVAPMHYPTHCTSQLVGVTGERLTEVVCHGWGDDNQILKDNAYGNPFWNESAMFKTNKGNAFRVNIWWKGAHRGCERAQWIGDQMSFYAPHPNGLGPVLVRAGERMETDDAGFTRKAPTFERYQQKEWWKTDLLPEPLRHNSGHEGSHTFLTHEFVDALTHNRKPKIDVHEALAYTVPGIVAHQSAMEGGTLKKIPSFASV
ncbi:MAG: Gfo/Idh/MocA family oxidoreductase [Sedimentisphaerales bacterium]|nr:Gfo/Idh/MocA family oxidoreductase [Sedimentisphaerales bacterium]